MNEQEILKLAELARIELDEAEVKEFSEDMGNILKYVGQVNDLTLEGGEDETGPVFNVMREDGDAHESGVHTEDLLNAAPDREGNYFKVKKIL